MSDDDTIDDTEVHQPPGVPDDVWAAALIEWGSDRQPIENIGQQRLLITCRAIMAERARAVSACEAQKAIFASDGYATPQPLGGLMERFACDQCIEAIRRTT